MSPQLMAVDIGNSYAKLGLFSPTAEAAIRSLPLPTNTFDFITADGPADELLAKLPQETLHWRICSVNRAGQQKLQQWVRYHRPADELQLLTHTDLPIHVDVDEPTKVGL